MEAGAEIERAEAPAPQTPEARRRRLVRAGQHVDRTLARLGPGSRVRIVLARAASGIWNDGFIHAGNIAYLTLLTLFPFFIMLAAIGEALGRDAATRAAIAQFLGQVPPAVAATLRQPIAEVLGARSGELLWIGALAGLWSVGGFIATLKDILYRAYGVRSTATFWMARLRYTAITLAAVLLVLMSFLLQAALTLAEQLILRWLPFADQGLVWLLSVSRAVPGLVIFAAFYLLFYVMTPGAFRAGCRKWPGPAFIAIWWLMVTALLPRLLSLLGGYDLTYGSLAGVIIALVYFFALGLGVVFAAHLNAALAEVPQDALRGAALTQPKDDM